MTHRFASADPAYRGWQWAVTVARVPRGKTVTVDEAVLLPGEDALLAQAWVPWSQRLAPGDLGVGDLLATEPDDERLEPGYAAAGGSERDRGEVDDDTDRVALWELGLGRVRVLSRIGRDDAVDRWYSGEHGPTAPLAEAAPAPCSTCGFVLPLGGLAAPGVRRLRERLLAQRRQGRLLRPRLRRPLRGRGAAADRSRWPRRSGTTSSSTSSPCTRSRTRRGRSTRPRTPRTWATADPGPRPGQPTTAFSASS